MTTRQTEVLRFISDFIEEKGHAPSYPEIGKHFGWTSLASVSDAVNVLWSKGMLKYQRFQRRSIELTTRGNEELSKPIPRGYETSEEVDPEGIQPWP